MRALPRVDRGWRQTDCTGRVGHGVDGEQRSVAADKRFVPIPHGALGAREAPYVFEGPQLSPSARPGVAGLSRRRGDLASVAAENEQLPSSPRRYIASARAEGAVGKTAPPVRVRVVRGSARRTFWWVSRPNHHFSSGPGDRVAAPAQNPARRAGDLAPLAR